MGTEISTVMESMPAKDQRRLHVIENELGQIQEQASDIALQQRQLQGERIIEAYHLLGDDDSSFHKWSMALHEQGIMNQADCYKYKNLYEFCKNKNTAGQTLNGMLLLSNKKNAPIASAAWARIRNLKYPTVKEVGRVLNEEWSKVDPSLLPSKPLAKPLSVAEALDEIERVAHRMFNAFIDDDLAEVVSFWLEMPEAFNVE